MNIAVSALYLLLSVFVLAAMKRKGAGIKRLATAGLFSALLLTAYLLRKSYTPAVIAQYIPLYKLFKIAEYGYQSILRDLLLFALPFLPAGLLLPAVFPGAGVIISFLCGAASVFIMDIPSLILGMTFVADEYAYAAFGMAAGTGLSIILMHFLKSNPLFKRLGFLPPFRKNLAGAVLVTGIAYFGIALIMITDFGEIYGELNLFRSDTPLPADITVSANLSDAAGKAAIYETERQDFLKRGKMTAEKLGIEAEVQYVEDACVFAEEGYILRFSPDGSWIYTSPEVPEGEVPSKEQAEKLARDFFEQKQPANTRLGELNDAAEKTNAHLIPEFTEDLDMTRDQYDELTELLRQPAGYDLYFKSSIDGCAIIGANEVMVSVRQGGIVTEIRKFDGDLKKKEKARIISQKEAYLRLLEGKGAYTLFSPAVSAEICDCELAYMVNSAQGYYLPVWRFKAVASSEDGTKTEFEAYVPAMK